MLQTKENTVKIEGILSEINLKYGSFKKNGADVKSVGGSIKIRVEQEINKVMTTLEVPVYMFASQYTNNGNPNPAYESIERVMNEYVSIAASDIDHADCVRITKGEISMNEYYGQNGKLNSYPRVRASFVTKVKREELRPTASFSVVFMIGNQGFKTDAEGVETDRYEITGFVPQYGEKIDVVPFVVLNKGVIDAVSNYWNQGDTVKASGKLNFSSYSEATTVETDFGEPEEQIRTVVVSDLVITGGSQTPLEGDFALNEDDVKAALARRKEQLNAQKDRNANRGTSGKAPAASGSKFGALGF